MPRGVWASPWTYSSSDYQGLRVAVTIPFNNTTLAIINPGLSGVRDAGCLYDRVLIGRPDGVLKVFLIPEGSFTVNRAQLSNQGFDTIVQVTEANFTLGTTETPT